MYIAGVWAESIVTRVLFSWILWEACSSILAKATLWWSVVLMLAQRLQRRTSNKTTLGNAFCWLWCPLCLVARWRSRCRSPDEHDKTEMLPLSVFTTADRICSRDVVIVWGRCNSFRLLPVQVTPGVIWN